MKKGEKNLIKQLCSFRSDKLNEDLLEFATPEVLGYLFFNRMQAIAYGVLKKNEYLSMINREFRNSLKSAYEQNIQKNNVFFHCLDFLSDVLKEHKDKYAMLKGAILCKAYPEGYRTSNDIDLLVRPQDITLIGETLTKAGFRQGYIRNNEFIPASRKEIIESKMLRGETVPYIFETGFPQMNYLEVDINFSLDYKNGDTNIPDSMLNNSLVIGNMSALSRSNFFIHLCCHLHKEATTLPWVKMKRDMTLYKYADIYMLLDEMHEEKVCGIFERAKSFGLDKICAFAVLQTAELFNMKSDYAVKAASDVLRDDLNFLHRVVSPSEKKIYIYNTKDIAERFFMNDRTSDLKEVNEHEKA